jgi:hypothetical protein
MQSFRSSMNIEMWFSRKTAPVLDAPTLSATASEPEPDRVEEARRRVTQVHDELNAIDHEFRRFKNLHKVTASKFGVLLRVECSFVERAAIEREWKEMLKRRDATVAAWHEALRDWSSAKGQP